MSDLGSKFKDIKEAKAKKAGPSMREMAEEALKIAAGEDRLVTSNEPHEAVALYRLTSDNVLTYYSDKLLEVAIFDTFPKILDKQRKEIMKFIKLMVFKEAAIDFKDVGPVAFADEPHLLTWNRLRIKRTELAKVSLDELKEFKHILSLCDDPRGLVLWIGSLLDPTSGRTQYLHLHGGGGNGKSTLFQAIESVIGEQHVVRSRADEFMNQHWGSVIEGARILIFPDENSTQFFSSGKFKIFTGEATVDVNPKYEKTRKLRLTHKTAVFSNNKVEISTNVADRRRLLSVSMEQDPGTNVGYRWWFQGLLDSGEKILAYCYSEYLKAVEADPSVRAFIPQQEATIEEAIDRKYGDIMDAISENYEVTGEEEHSVTRAELHRTLTDALKEKPLNRIFQQQVREALERLNVKLVKSNGTRAYRGIKKRGGSGGGGSKTNVSDRAKALSKQVIQ